MDTTVLRPRYAPGKTDVLLVGESPPDGGTFFYAENSKLFLSTRKAFERFLETTFARPADFLEKFKAMGFYLEDLCEIPVNKMPDRERRLMRRAGIENLAERLADHKPQAILVIMKVLTPSVRKAMEQASLGPVLMYTLPFPAYQHARRYEKELLDVLVDLQSRGIIGVL